MMAGRHRLSRRARLRVFMRRHVIQSWPPPRTVGHVVITASVTLVITLGATTVSVAPEPVALPRFPVTTAVSVALPRAALPMTVAPLTPAAQPAPTPVKHEPTTRRFSYRYTQPAPVPTAATPKKTSKKKHSSDSGDDS